MTELISIFLFIIGLVLSWLILPIFVKNKSRYSKAFVWILFLLLWNSEYMAACIFFFAVLYFTKNNDVDDFHLELVLNHFIYVMVFTFLFRKIRDVGVHYIIELNLQNIK